LEIIRVKKDDEDICYIRCEEHEFYYKGVPPLTVGCSSCWMTYYLGMKCQADPNLLGEDVDQMEHILSHLQEEIEKGKWDFVPFNTPEITIEKEN
jgi:hypothetical protein